MYAARMLLSVLNHMRIGVDVMMIDHTPILSSTLQMARPWKAQNMRTHAMGMMDSEYRTAKRHRNGEMNAMMTQLMQMAD